MPWWAVHPECTALAVMFANPYWAKRAVPEPDRRHRLFYQHMLAVLGVDDSDDTSPFTSWVAAALAVSARAASSRIE